MSSHLRRSPRTSVGSSSSSPDRHRQRLPVWRERQVVVALVTPAAAPNGASGKKALFNAYAASFLSWETFATKSANRDLMQRSKKSCDSTDLVGDGEHTRRNCQAKRAPAPALRLILHELLHGLVLSKSTEHVAVFVSRDAFRHVGVRP